MVNIRHVGITDRIGDNSDRSLIRGSNNNMVALPHIQPTARITAHRKQIRPTTIKEVVGEELKVNMGKS